MWMGALCGSTLKKRGVAVELVTDSRAAQHAGAFPPEAVHVIPSATFRSRDPIALAKTGSLLGYGLLKAWLKLPKLRPAVVVGFGGYVALPAYLAARLPGSRVPVVVHEANASAGIANKVGARHAAAVAAAVPGIGLDGPVIGMPLRRAITTIDCNTLRSAVGATALEPLLGLTDLFNDPGLCPTTSK